MESAKFQVIQWLVTIAMSAGALGLGTFPCNGGVDGSVCAIVQLKQALLVICTDISKNYCATSMSISICLT